MTKDQEKRPISESEEETLRELLKAQKGGFSRFFEGAKQAFIVWFLFSLLFMLAWLLVSWLVRVLFGVEIGFDKSKIGDSVLVVALVAFALYSIVSTVKWMTSHEDRRPKILADLDRREVIQTTFQFTSAKRFQEQEHGGFFYFLRTLDDRVFVLFDYESQDLGVEGKDPMDSGFQPRSNLQMTEAPSTEIVLSREFSGDALAVSETQDLLVSPEFWPESDSFCRTRWENLEKRFSRSSSEN